MTDQEMIDIALSNVEKNLSDAVAEDGMDELFNTVYVLAFDALVDRNVPDEEARRIATKVMNDF